MLKQVGNRSVLYIMAASQEYGPHLRQLLTPVFCGVGPVEAGVIAAKTLAELQAENRLPDVVVSLGSCGSNTLVQTEVYQVVSVSFRDMDATALGFEKGRTPMLDLPVSVLLPIRVPELPAATLSTGASIINGQAYDGIDAEMADMETFAILRACMAFGVDLVGLRGVSDGVEDLRKFSDWTQYLHIIDEKLARAVERLEDHLINGPQ